MFCEANGREVSGLRRKKQVLSKAEKRIMEILWEENRPLTRFDIADQLGLHPVSVWERLQDMMKNGLVVKAGHVVIKKMQAILYKPKISYEEYVHRILGMLPFTKNGLSGHEMVSMFINLLEKEGKSLDKKDELPFGEE